MPDAQRIRPAVVIRPRVLRPVRWRPPRATRRAHLSQSAPALPRLHRVEVPAAGPEDVVLDDAGRVLAGLTDGRVVRIDPVSGTIDTLGNTGGRPLGLEIEPDGRVLVCDARRGLLRLDPATGDVATLVHEIDGEPLNFASNVVADDDGTIYFSASSRRFDLDHYTGDLMEHSGTGRLLRLDQNGAVTTLLDGLHFANGVVLAPDRSCVLVAETGAYRITRYWLRGTRAGRSEAFVQNLPGFPDNMSFGSDGLVWIALAAPRNRLLDALLPLPGVLRQLVWLLPEAVQPPPARTVWVLGMSFDARIVHDLQTEPDNYGFVTSVAERDGRLVLGSLTESAIALTSVPTVSRPSSSR